MIRSSTQPLLSVPFRLVGNSGCAMPCGPRSCLRSSQQVVSPLRAAIAIAYGGDMTNDLTPDLWVIVRSTGEYSDREETPIRYCLSEEDAKKAVKLAAVEAQRDVEKKPKFRIASSYAYRTDDGSWLPGTVHPSDPRVRGAAFTRKPNAEEIEAQNIQWASEYEAACLALNHVDPQGSWSGDSYYYTKVSRWPARGIPTEGGDACGSVHG